MPDPAFKNLPDVLAHRNEVGRKRFREFCPHLSRVLLNEAGVKVYVPETKRCERVVSRPGHQRKGQEGAIAFFDVGPAWHAQRHVSDLLDRWNRPSLRGPGDSSVLQRQRKVLRVQIGELRLEPVLLG